MEMAAVSSSEPGFGFPWDRMPLQARMAHDPVVALALWALGISGVAAALVSLYIWPFPLVEMLPLLGGVVVLLGSYFAARTLRDNELAKATEMLGDDSLAVRIAGIHQLGLIGMSVPRFRTYAKFVLCGFLADSSDDENEGSRSLACEVLGQLRRLDDGAVVALSVELAHAFPAMAPSPEPCDSDAVPGS